MLTLASHTQIAPRSIRLLAGSFRGRLRLTGSALFLSLVALAPAATPAPRTDKDAHPQASPAAKQLQRFHVPAGFEVQLVADETQIQKPMNLAFDSAGRLWTTGSALYPFPAKTDALGRDIVAWETEWSGMKGNIGHAKPPPPPTANDTVRILSDFDAQGRARKVEVFADGLNIPIGVLPLPRPPHAKGDTVIVFSIPSIWRLEDTDGDGKADRREELYTGFGFVDTHGMSSNYLHWIDGWIYGCHGFNNRSEVSDRSGRGTSIESGNTYRFRPDGSAFEVYTHGQTNPFGLTVDPWSNFYSADSHSKPVYLLLPGAFYEGINKQHDGLGFAPAITTDSHGSSSIAGIAYYDADTFPEEFRGNVFIGNPVTQRINRDRFEWEGSTPRVVRMPDFLTCDDPWFRPIQVKLGPEGALYVADFYTPIIGHYEHPLLDPRRDHAHGRIWRVVWRGKSSNPTPALAPPTAPALAQLAATNLTLRTLATNALVAQASPASLVAELKQRTSSAVEIPSLLWAAERLNVLPDELLVQTLTSPNESAAIAAATILGERRALPEADAERLRNQLAASATPARVRRAIVQTLARHPAAENLATLVVLAESLRSSLDRELEFAVRVALREHLKASAGFAALDKNTVPASSGAITLAAFAPTLLADVAVAVPGEASATFVLNQLRRLNYDAKRAVEYVLHAARQLPTERTPELLAATDQMKAAPADQQVALAIGLESAAARRKVAWSPELTRWMETVLLGALQRPGDATLISALGALKSSSNPAKREPIERLLAKPGNARVRSAALEALMNLPGAAAHLRRSVTEATQVALQRRAAELMVERGDVALATESLPLVPTDLAGVLAQTLAKSDATFVDLLSLVEGGRVTARVFRHPKVVTALRERDATLQGRAAKLAQNLPNEDARLDGIIATRLAALRTLSVDRTRGATVFTANCIACHRFRDQGASIAPNLDGIAARGLERLAEDIIDPSRNVDGAFRQTIVETNDGRTIGGLNLRESAAALTLTDISGADVNLPRESVKTITTSPLSLMPAAFDTLLSEQEFADLITYLTKSEP